MTSLYQMLIRLIGVAVFFILAACTSSFERPQNLISIETSSYQAQRQSMSDSESSSPLRSIAG